VLGWRNRVDRHRDRCVENHGALTSAARSNRRGAAPFSRARYLVDNGAAPLITFEGLGVTLPYRSDPDDIRRYLVALAQGGGESRFAALGLSTKNHEGVVAAIVALGLAAGRQGPLSDKGRRVAVTESAPDSILTWREVIQDYAPYAAITGAVESGTAPLPLTLSWIETYWAANGIGNSESNRAEGAATFARIAEAAGYGRFRQGRRGHVSRIEWSGGSTEGDAGSPPRSTPRRNSTAPPNARREAVPADRSPPGTDPGSVVDDIGTGSPGGDASTEGSSGSSVYADPSRAPEPNHIVWEISPGRTLRLSLPPRLTPPEAKRINELLRLLIAD